MTEVETMDKQETSDPNTEDDLPQKILEKYNSGLQVQLIKGYRCEERFHIQYPMYNSRFVAK